MNIECKERDLNPPDFEPVKTFDDFSCDEQVQIINDIFLAEEPGDILAEMLDNETLKKVIIMVHNAWQAKHCLNHSEIDFVDMLDDILLIYSKALKKTLSKRIDEEIKHIQECRLHPFNEDE